MPCTCNHNGTTHTCTHYHADIYTRCETQQRTLFRCQSEPMPELSCPMTMRLMSPTLGSAGKVKLSTWARSKLFLELLRLWRPVVVGAPSLCAAKKEAQAISTIGPDTPPRPKGCKHE